MCKKSSNEWHGFHMFVCSISATTFRIFHLQTKLFWIYNMCSPFPLATYLLATIPSRKQNEFCSGKLRSKMVFQGMHSKQKVSIYVYQMPSSIVHTYAHDFETCSFKVTHENQFLERYFMMMSQTLRIKGQIMYSSLI